MDDQSIGRNLQRLRGAMSQQVLADEMRARGFKWSQATVWAAEKGERPLRVTEASALVDILGGGYVYGLGQLVAPDTEAELLAQMRAVKAAYKRLSEQAHEFFEAQAGIEAALDDADRHDDAISSRLRDDAKDWLGKEPADAVREATEVWRRDFDPRRAGGASES
ncbi:hypothetical protein [Nocardioides sp. zg-DK7169]|uniref:hypothetical protein n=1 Tax=Nocardioides sp. zg-DK7169 TaxID=2736600 RepID=UPI0015532072|nr:hypothetical protein [Nocardioides sp. zg-DK7169]NPC96615.1 hypothetical protein [Nocardioides sp. zg-DK7169]